MKRYEHVIPTGETVTFAVELGRLDREIIVSYPDTIDLSAFSARDAYPVEEIGADFGSFWRCVANGSDHGRAWEVWQVR